MGYKEDYEEAEKKGKTKQVTKRIYKFTEEGETLDGVVQDIYPFTEGNFDAEANSYDILTDEGLITTVLGSATDKQLKDIDPRGQRIHIVFRGQKLLDDSRSVNLFDIKVY